LWHAGVMLVVAVLNAVSFFHGDEAFFFEVGWFFGVAAFEQVFFGDCWSCGFWRVG